MSTYSEAIINLLNLYSSGSASAEDTAAAMAALRPAYAPTFREPVTGKYNARSAVTALNVGSDAYITERELNEVQWIRREELADIIREVTCSGVLVNQTNADAKPFGTLDLDVDHPNSISLYSFRTVVHGHMVNHTTTDDTGADMPSIYLRLPNPPVSGVRHDLVYVEYWLEQLKDRDSLPVYGCTDNGPSGYVILDERVDAETTRPVQLQWRLAVYEDYDNACAVNGLVDADEQPIAGIIPRIGLTRPLRTHSYERVPGDPGLFRAGTGVPMDSQVNTVDGWVWAMPLLLITRLNNSGYDEMANPTGGVDYVDSSTDCDRPDGKYANVIYDELVKPMYAEAHLGPAQLDRLYIKLADYKKINAALRNKIMRLSEDMDNVNNVFRAQGYVLPGLHDLDVYGGRMFRQFVLTTGALLDDDEHRIIYRRRHYSVGKDMSTRAYAVIPTLVDYDYTNIGALGDLYVTKAAKSFTVYNTGAKGLRMDTTAFAVDDDMVFSGEAQFFGMDGAVIQLPFTLDPDRHLVHVCPLDDTNGRNGEIFVRMVDQELIVYNTGVTVNKRGESVYTAGNSFQWTVIDTFHKNWHNCSMTLVTLKGQAGAPVANSLFGENYRVVCGTPVFTAAQLATDGSIGEVYVDAENEGRVIVYNSGSAAEDTVMPRVQVLVFHDVPYVEYYDTLEIDDTDTVPTIVDAPDAVMSDVEELRQLLRTTQAQLVNVSSQLVTTRSRVAALDAMVAAEDKVEFTLAPGTDYTYTLPDSFGTLVTIANTGITVLVRDDVTNSATYGQLVSADAVADTSFPDDGRSVRVLNVSSSSHDFTLLVSHTAGNRTDGDA